MANACWRKSESINFMQLFLDVLTSWNQFLFFFILKNTVFIYLPTICLEIFHHQFLWLPCLSLSLMEYLSFLSKISHWNLIFPFFLLLLLQMQGLCTKSFWINCWLLYQISLVSEKTNSHVLCVICNMIIL